MSVSAAVSIPNVDRHSENNSSKLNSTEMHQSHSPLSNQIVIPSAVNNNKRHLKSMQPLTPSSNSSTTSQSFSPPSQSHLHHSNNLQLNAVIQTSDDAAVSKHSAAALNYFHDEYLRYFISGPSRRAPLINRGYYTRVKAIQQIINEFVEKHHLAEKKCQIISLGKFGSLKSQTFVL